MNDAFSDEAEDGPTDVENEPITDEELAMLRNEWIALSQNGMAIEDMIFGLSLIASFSGKAVTEEQRLKSKSGPMRRAGQCQQEEHPDD